MNSRIIKIISFTMASVAMFATSCKKNYTNPAAATDAQVFSSPQGLTGVAVGLQRIYAAGRASNLYNRVSADGLLTLQDSVVNQGNTAEYQLSIGAVDGTNTMMAGLWTSSNKLIYEADRVLAGAANVPDKGYASGLIAYASIFKALALGDLSMFWEKVPAATGPSVAFEDRMEGFNRAIATLDAALAAIAAAPISASFISNVPPGIDIINTIHALKARFAIFIGNNALALSEANAVDLTKKSTLNFSSVNLNPIFETVTSTNNVYVPKDSTMGLPPSLAPNLADKRVPFYISTNATNPRFRVAGFGATSTTAWPLYLPGEMTLIKAEAYARQNDLVNALIELNKIVTKTPASDPFGVGADLPPIVGPLTQAQLLTEIYRQRAIELYFSGLRMEDMRRFGRPNSEKKRNFLPYPFQERDNNPNTPPDPTF
ncbi:MAG TPA: RagB/SusD family nutrient uptake outer membrane protein [Chitinophagaceae bacterium]|nr:RagB/SusD family nutrient uptake outer membrane protein [Chitinophagaceae bacterium]